jgi:hypothetical protein
MLLRYCNLCGEQYQTYPSEVQDGRRFCSPACGKAGKRSNKKHGMSNTRLHEIWCHMKSRCYCETNQAFSYYGGRGIAVCEEWRSSFAIFKKWSLTNGYTESLELDRKDVNGNYEPSNCRWANRTEQMRNTRKRRDAETSKFKGVSWCSNVSKWRVQITVNKKNRHVGLYLDEEEAARAYDTAARELFGEFASTNFKE